MARSAKSDKYFGPLRVAEEGVSGHILIVAMFYQDHPKAA